MKLIKLTKSFQYGTSINIYVNAAHIATFFENRDNDGEDTVVKLINEDESIIVDELPDEIMRRIQFAKEM